MLLEYDYPLATHNTLRLPVRAEWFLASDSLDDIRQQISNSLQQGMACTILGDGSNVVLAADLPGLVIRPRLRGIEVLAEQREHVLIRVAAGENWDRLVASTLERGWYGLENLSLIPGSVGAAPLQNIGAYGVELADFVDQVRALNLHSGQLREFSREDCRFAYRDSFFKSIEPGRWMIVDLVLRLEKVPRLKLDYGNLREQISLLAAAEQTPQRVRQLVCETRRSKLPDPSRLANAGSFFKNPLVDADHYQRLKKDFPELVAFAQPGGNYKLAAGWLIEAAGWKGRRNGPVGMHEEQALVLVNYGGATGAEVLALADQVRADVHRLFEVSLEQEPVLLPARAVS